MCPVKKIHRCLEKKNVIRILPTWAVSQFTWVGCPSRTYVWETLKLWLSAVKQKMFPSHSPSRFPGTVYKAAPELTILPQCCLCVSVCACMHVCANIGAFIVSVSRYDVLMKGGADKHGKEVGSHDLH